MAAALLKLGLTPPPEAAPAAPDAFERSFEELNVIHRGVTRINAADTMLVTYNGLTGKFILWHAAPREVSHAELSKLLNDSKETSGQQGRSNQARRETRGRRPQARRSKS